MAQKLKPQRILAEDLSEYLASYSDFSFELSVLKMLREFGIDCEHGGLYDDPATKKTREFDIRALRTWGRFNLRMAIECKNVRENFPLLISGVPRHVSESYHDVVLLRNPELQDSLLDDDGTSISIPYLGPERSRATVVRVAGEDSIYKPGDFLGKSTVQVGRLGDGSLSANDSELYEKWGQCLSSADALVARSYWDGKDIKERFALSAVVPLIVVPDGRLWMVAYNDDGNRTSEPTQTNRCSMFAGKFYKMDIMGPNYQISHIEIVTWSGLATFVQTYLASEQLLKSWFQKEAILRALRLAQTGGRAADA